MKVATLSPETRETIRLEDAVREFSEFVESKHTELAPGVWSVVLALASSLAGVIFSLLLLALLFSRT